MRDADLLFGLADSILLWLHERGLLRLLAHAGHSGLPSIADFCQVWRPFKLAAKLQLKHISACHNHMHIGRKTSVLSQ